MEDLGIVDGLVQLSFLVQAVLGRVAAGYDLSIIQVRLLGVLRGREPGMLELAAFLNLDKSSVSGLVDRAEQRRLARRIAASDDRRVVRVGLTKRGTELARAFAAEVDGHLSALLGDLSATERKRLAELAGRIIAGSRKDDRRMRRR